MTRDKPVVFFDVGGTLMEVSPSVGYVYSKALADRGASVPPGSIQHAFDRAWGVVSEAVPHGSDRYALFPGGEEEWWRRVSSHAFDLCGVAADRRPPVEELRSHFARADAWQIFPETRDVLRNLAVGGYRLGVISNWDSRLPRLLASLDLDGHFESVIYSAAEGVEKPHPAIFAAALEAFGVSAAGAVHVGDRLEEDYAGARSAGLRAVLVRREPIGPELLEEVSHWGHEEDVVTDLEAAVRRIAG